MKLLERGGRSGRKEKKQEINNLPARQKECPRQQ
jgi:hypothetical protein